jgi:hypothetical protein
MRPIWLVWDGGVVSPACQVEGCFVEVVVVAAISGALSLVALVAAVIIARRQTDLEAVSAILAKRQIEVQARVASIEEARRADEAAARGLARVTARFDVSFGVLCLTNEGPAVAREVTVELRAIGDGEPLGLDLRDLPVDLRPSQQLFLDAQHASPQWAATTVAMVRWTDDTGANDETFVLLTRF